MIRDELHQINLRAHASTFHPGILAWPDRSDQEELDFISRVGFEKPGEEEKAIVYITKDDARNHARHGGILAVRASSGAHRAGHRIRRHQHAGARTESGAKALDR
jgi:hypothetical protein